jgi:hypothetical protein
MTEVERVAIVTGAAGASAVQWRERCLKPASGLLPLIAIVKRWRRSR